MDASYAPPGKRYVLLDNELADMIEVIDTRDLTMLLEVLMCASDHDCSCGMRADITITATDGEQLHLVGSPRNKSGAFI